MAPYGQIGSNRDIIVNCTRGYITIFFPSGENPYKKIILHKFQQSDWLRARQVINPKRYRKLKLALKIEMKLHVCY